MNKKPLLLRSLLVLVVIAVFCAAMYPLAEKDYYEVFQEMLIDPDNADAARVIELAKAKEEADPNLFQSEALQQAAVELGISLRGLVDAPDHRRTCCSGNRRDRTRSRQDATLYGVACICLHPLRRFSRIFRIRGGISFARIG